VRLLRLPAGRGGLHALHQGQPHPVPERLPTVRDGPTSGGGGLMGQKRLLFLVRIPGPDLVSGWYAHGKPGKVMEIKIIVIFRA